MQPAAFRALPSELEACSVREHLSQQQPHSPRGRPRVRRCIGAMPLPIRVAIRRGSSMVILVVETAIYSCSIILILIPMEIMLCIRQIGYVRYVRVRVLMADASGHVGSSKQRY
eukprot:SAG11_NODE_8526_length_1005_cov_1.895143_2_plen_114_part_00